MSTVAAGLVERLGRHYVKPGRGGGLFVPEVGTNDWGVTGSRCDAVYVGFSSTHGRILIGHEVKVTRQDWLHELDQPGKADFWHDNSHAWYVVAPAAGIVKVEELPPGWGLLLPNPRSSVRFDIEVSAGVREDVTPSWLAIRSVMARADTLQHGAIAQARSDGAELVLGQLIKDWRRNRGLGSTGSAAVDRLLRQLKTLIVDAAQTGGRRIGGITIGQLVQRITDRLDADNTIYSVDVEAILDAISDHAAVQRTANQLRHELQSRADHAQALLADLPDHLAAVIAAGTAAQSADTTVAPVQSQSAKGLVSTSS